MAEQEEEASVSMAKHRRESPAQGHIQGRCTADWGHAE